MERDEYMKNYFYLEESASMPKKFFICLNHDRLHLEHTNGSFNIICARVMGLSYANYLRMCRDRYGADIIGKGCKYPVAFFEKNKKADELVSILNSKAKEILKGRK